MKRTLVLILSVLVLTSCKGFSKKSDEVNGDSSSQQGTPSSHQRPSDLHKEVPLEKQKQNDELDQQIQALNQASESPHLVRERFALLVEKKRTAFRQKIQKLRDDYRSEEDKRRDEQLKRQKAKRDAFTGSKREFKESREFFADQERDRLRFVSDERDRRQTFESEIRAQQKDFDSFIREKQSEFNERFRLYSKKYSERPKDTKAVTGDESDFRKLREIPATQLGTED